MIAIPAINAAGAILHYVHEDLNLSIDHIKTLSPEHLSRYMLLDRSTQKNLELFETLQEGKKTHTLLDLIDRTETPMGGRLLKTWLAHPLLDIEEIKKRQDGIAGYLKDLAEKPRGPSAPQRNPRLRTVDDAH